MYACIVPSILCEPKDPVAVNEKQITNVWPCVVKRDRDHSVKYDRASP